MGALFGALDVNFYSYYEYFPQDLVLYRIIMVDSCKFDDITFNLEAGSFAVLDIPFGFVTRNIMNNLDFESGNMFRVLGFSDDLTSHNIINKTIEDMIFSGAPAGLQ